MNVFGPKGAEAFADDLFSLTQSFDWDSSSDAHHLSHASKNMACAPDGLPHARHLARQQGLL
ncbi:hypothetical protein TRIP_B40110 [uncultured Desulfatiglans sp.]|nr:hypothetical protein TRIP_B40110 [uncultured Desulfatiglans sp.]